MTVSGEEPPGSDHRPLPTVSDLVDELRSLGVREVHSYAWRDLDDPEAGGSELHADEILGRWAAGGLEIRHRTSTDDRPQVGQRRGYTVERRGGRFGVFGRVIGREALRRTTSGVAVVEIWNGVPWLSPIWHRGPRVCWLHHVHDAMWFDVLPRPIAAVGRFVEMRIAPRVYRRTRIVTLSDTSATGIRKLGHPPDRLSVIPPGVATHFRPDEQRRSSTPQVVIVGRLAPVKRIDAALRALAEARRTIGELEVEVVGDGPERQRLEAWIVANRAQDWVRLAGRVDDEELVLAYQRAWLVVGASYAEGWGMSMTEGAACGTPAVATDISGHRGAVRPGETGLLVPEPADLTEAVVALLRDDERRRTMGQRALSAAGRLSWDAVAARHLEVLIEETRRRSIRGSRRPDGADAG